MRMIAIAIAFTIAQIAAPAVASSVAAPGLSKAAALDLSAAKKKAAKKKKEKVQYMRSAS
ncbi:MAG: hypothetical protein AB7T86_09075 [Xanthobacteraceae bacterium]|uniref:hypothetical protein n=1 Tax=Pseudolabrys sp. TaxID=1960880 RepID=UPI003D0B085B